MGKIKALLQDPFFEEISDTDYDEIAEQRGKWFDDGLTKAYEYAESGKNTKIDKRGVACDAYLEGFLDGIAYFIAQGKQYD